MVNVLVGDCLPIVSAIREARTAPRAVTAPDPALYFEDSVSVYHRREDGSSGVEEMMTERHCFQAL